jgi:hypothetical protein
MCVGLRVDTWSNSSARSYSDGDMANWGRVRLDGDDDLSVGGYVRNLGMGIEGKPVNGDSQTVTATAAPTATARARQRQVLTTLASSRHSTHTSLAPLGIPAPCALRRSGHERTHAGRPAVVRAGSAECDRQFVEWLGDVLVWGCCQGKKGWLWGLVEWVGTRVRHVVL